MAGMLFSLNLGWSGKELVDRGVPPSIMAEEESEAVFEIADFSCRTTFERLCSFIEQKLWSWMADEMSDQDEVCKEGGPLGIGDF
jgi:hypothetical protein